MTKILEAHHITKVFEGRSILQNISLSLTKGNVHVLLGPSGSGKTSLLRILGGLLDADTGEVLLDGEKIEGPEDRLVPGYEEISIAHQDFKLKHRMSVRENIRYELLSYTKDYQNERIASLLKLFKIEHLEDKDISLLSGGEKQRVAIARAMAHEPDVLLMDEPFSNLDLGTKSSLLAEIRTLAQETETAILLVTHDTRDAMEVGDQVSVLFHGSIIRSGTPAQVYQSPQYQEVANLFGPFNLIGKKHYEACGIDSSADAVGVWPESIKSTENGLPVTILDRVYMGAYWKITLATNNDRLIMYAQDENVGEQVKITRHFELKS